MVVRGDIDDAGDDFVALERELTAEHRGAWVKLTERVRWLEGRRPWFVGFGVIGGFAAALSRAFEEPTGIAVAVVGALVVAFSGLAVAALDFKKLELTSGFARIELVAERAIAAGRAAAVGQARKVAERQALDRRRVHRLTALAGLRDVLTQALAAGLDVATAADAMIDVAAFDIVGAIGFEAGEYWTLSVFEIDPSEETASRVAAAWVDQAGARNPGRSWPKGEGYTGVAWRDGVEVIEADTSTPAAMRRYHVLAARSRPYDSGRYRSVAAIPVSGAPGGDLWGVVTATSDRIGRFQDEEPGGPLQAVDVIRDVAGMIALLVAAERYASEGTGDEGDGEDPDP